MKRSLILSALGLVLAAGLATAQQAALDPDRFEPEIHKFEEADRTSPPPPHGDPVDQAGPRALAPGEKDP